MIQKNFGMIIILLCATTFVFTQEKISKMNKDEAAIRANVEQIAKGWNMKSAAEFAKPFAEDSDYVVNNGFHVKGIVANVKDIQAVFETREKHSVLSYTVEQIRFLRPDVAVVHALTARKMVQGDSTQEGKGRITMVMTKNKDKWEIVAYQNTPIQEFEAKGEK